MFANLGIKNAQNRPESVFSRRSGGYPFGITETLEFQTLSAVVAFTNHYPLVTHHCFESLTTASPYFPSLYRAIAPRSAKTALA